MKRHRAERSLTESEQRFQNAADIAPVMIWMSGTDKLCTFFNKGWLEFTGRPLDRELGSGWVDGVHGEDRVLPPDLRCCLRCAKAVHDGVRLRRADGGYRWLLDTQGRRGANRWNSFIGSCIDIGERKRAN